MIKQILILILVFTLIPIISAEIIIVRPGSDTIANTSLLNVNSSDFWDSLDTPSDISTADLTDDNTYVQVAGDSMTGDLEVTNTGDDTAITIHGGDTNLNASLIFEEVGLSRWSLLLNGLNNNFYLWNDHLDTPTWMANLVTNAITFYGNGTIFGDFLPGTTLTYDIGSGPLRWGDLYVSDISADDISAYNIDLLGDITGPFGNFTDLIVGGVNFSELDESYLNLSGTNANQNVKLSDGTTDYNLTAGTINLTNGIGSMTIDGAGYIRPSDGTAGFHNTDNIKYIGFDVSGDAFDNMAITCWNGSNNICSFEGNILVDDNITTKEWFNGQFNWTTDEWAEFDGSLWTFNESKLATTYYNATQSVAVAGTIDGGTLVDTQHPDGDYDGVTFNFSEASGSPGLDLRINFTGVVDFNKGYIRYKTNSLSGDYPAIQLWDYDDSEWEGGYGFLSENEEFLQFTNDVLDSNSHLQDGVVQMRLYKSANGNTQNEYYVDMLAIVDGYATPSGNVDLTPYWRYDDNDEDRNFLTDGNVTADYFNGNWNGSVDYVPYTGAIKDVNLGSFDLTTDGDILVNGGIALGDEDTFLAGNVGRLNIVDSHPSIRQEVVRTGGTIAVAINDVYSRATDGADVPVKMGTFGLYGTAGGDAKYLYLGANPTTAYNTGAVLKIDFNDRIGINLVTNTRPTETLDVNGNVWLIGDNQILKFGTTNTDLQISSDGDYGVLNASLGVKVYSDLTVAGNLTINGNVNISTGYTGTCVNATYMGGIAIGCND